MVTAAPDRMLERRVAELEGYRAHWLGREERMRREGRDEDAGYSHQWAVNCERALARLRAAGDALAWP